MVVSQVLVKWTAVDYWSIEVDLTYVKNALWSILVKWAIVVKWKFTGESGPNVLLRRPK